MFDTVVIDGLKLKTPREVTGFLKANNAELPNDFQTKDLDCSLATYKINSKWELLFEDRRPTGKKVPYEYPFERWQDNRPLLERLYWNYRNKKLFGHVADKREIDEIKTVLVKTKLTNTFEMYTYEEIGGKYLELSFIVKVIEGKVSSIKLDKWSIESDKDAAERKKNDEEFKKNAAISIAKQKEFRSKWYYPILKEVYNPFVFFSRLAAQKICDKIVRWSYRWTGV